MSLSVAGALSMILSSIPYNLLHWAKSLIASRAIHNYNSTYRKRFGDGTLNGTSQLEKDLEYPQSEEHLQESADEIIFYGVNSKAEYALIRLARYSYRESDAWIYLRTADGSSYQLKETVNRQNSEDEDEFSCGNLRIKVLSPMKEWRIEYSGSLMKKSEQENSYQETVCVKFDFQWSASSKVFDVYDPTLKNNIAEFTFMLATKEWKSYYPPPLKEFLKSWNTYLQVGDFKGILSVENKPEYELSLFGERQRHLDAHKLADYVRYPLIVGFVSQKKIGFHLQNNPNKGFLEIDSGIVVNPDGSLDAFKKVLTSFHGYPLNPLIGSFSTVDGSTYELSCHLVKEQLTLENKDSGHSRISLVELSFAKETGYGFYFTS